MTIEEALAEARENVAKNYTTEPCVMRRLIHEIEGHGKYIAALEDQLDSVGLQIALQQAQRDSSPNASHEP